MEVGALTSQRLETSVTATLGSVEDRDSHETYGDASAPVTSNERAIPGHGSSGMYIESIECCPCSNKLMFHSNQQLTFKCVEILLIILMMAELAFDHVTDDYRVNITDMKHTESISCHSSENCVLPCWWNFRLP